MKSVFFLRAAYFLLVCVCCGCSGSAQNTKEVTGHWQGMISDGRQEQELNIDVSADKVTYSIPAFGIIQENVKEYQFDAKKMKMVIPQERPIIITGMFNGADLTGVTNGGMKATFSLHKSSSKPVVYAEEEVNYLSGDIRIYGTLIKPGPGANYPAIVLIHGSSLKEGGQTREMMRYWAYVFVQNGMAALIYDRQGNGKSEGDKQRLLPVAKLAADANAGLHYIKSRKDFSNNNKVGIFGLSQGGWVAPLAVSENPSADFIVTVSAPGCTPDDQFRYFNEQQLTSSLGKINLPANTLAETTDAKKLAVEIASHNSDVTIQESAIPGFTDFNPLPAWEKISVPVLALWGASDNIVPAAASKDSIEIALLHNGNKNSTLLLLAGANHTLQIASGDQKFGGQVRIKSPAMDPVITKWINGIFK